MAFVAPVAEALAEGFVAYEAAKGTLEEVKKFAGDTQSAINAAGGPSNVVASGSDYNSRQRKRKPATIADHFQAQKRQQTFSVNGRTRTTPGPSNPRPRRRQRIGSRPAGGGRSGGRTRYIGKRPYRKSRISYRRRTSSRRRRRRRYD